MITKKHFGTLPDGREVTAYTLTNAKGSALTVLDLGATLVSLHVKDRSGALTDVLLGYDTLEEYLTGGEYIGGTIGRFAGRIANARFTLDGKTYHLTANDGVHSEHGGTGFHLKLWSCKADGANALVLTYESPDGEDGYPANMTATVRISLSDDDALKFEYTATSDAPTVCNLTNHAYFNLGGLKRDVLGHELWLRANQFTETNSELIPVAEKPVDGTIYDFRTPRKLGEAVYDTNYILDGGEDDVKATLYDPESGIFMEVLTDAPAMVVYASTTLPDQADKGGKRHRVGDALCLEAEIPPDAPNCERYQRYNHILRPGKLWKSQTTYRFSVK